MDLPSTYAAAQTERLNELTRHQVMTAKTPTSPTPVDNRKARSEATRTALMRATEKLIANGGIENTSIRDILAEADQKNTSALQYHFKNLKGLIEAILVTRSEEVRRKRQQMIDALLATDPEPELRTIAMLMVAPAMELARTDLSFRRYIQAFGHQLAVGETSAVAMAQVRGGGGSSGEQLGTLLRAALPHLSGKAYLQRLEFAIRQCAASTYHHSRQPNAFRGAQAEVFVNSLIDALVGLLSAPESRQTKAAARRLRERK